MKKHYDIGLLATIVLMFTTVCMETDIYVPAFPDMKLFFATSSDTIQWVLSINFIGICCGSLLFGPLSDSYGRKRTLQFGSLLFALASWSCIFFDNFNSFLLSRFIQGIGASSPMVITFAIILEKYEPKKVAQLCGGFNLFITGIMAVAPIIGNYLNIYHGWHSCFMLIATLASLSFICSMLFIPETLPQEKRIQFAVDKIIVNYGSVLRSYPYMAATFVCYLMFAALVLFTANLSLIFIEYLGVSQSDYGFYQASSPAAFALFSLLSIWIIGRFGIDKTKWAGVIISLLGAMLLMFTTMAEPNPVLICATMIVFTAGITLAAPIYGMQSANVFPEMRGIATGMSNALRHMIVAALVGAGSYAFNGSIKPVAILIILSTIVVVFLAISLMNRNLVHEPLPQ